MSGVLISVVIPTYRRPALLRKCLAALRRQTVPASLYEVLVVSDGPDAQTEEAVEELTDGAVSFHYLHLPQKKGPAAARDYGWQRAEGKLIAFTDDDTVPDEDWLYQLRTAYRNEDFIAYSGLVKVPLSKRPTDYEKNTAGLETAEFVTANCCCTKAALQKAGGFDERFSMAWREDSDLHFKLLLLKIPVIKLPQAVVVHPVRKARWGVSLREQKKGLFNALLYKKYPCLYRKKIQPSPPWNYYATVLAAITAVTAAVAHLSLLFVIAFVVWLILLVSFIIRRLKRTSKEMGHIAEMIVTSLCIPFLSVYWQWYGAWRYKVFFL